MTGPRRGNQRARVRMTDAEVRQFLDAPRTLVMSTFAPDGTIHSVAMWYGFRNGVLGTTTKAKSQKALNLRRDPRVTCLVEAGEAYAQLRGVEIVGRAEVCDDPEVVWAVGVSSHERHDGPLAEADVPRLRQALTNRVAILVHPDRIVSWDHRKLA